MTAVSNTLSNPSISRCVYEKCATENKLIAGRLKLCSRCRSVKYCSSACQKADWNEKHKQFCEFLASDIQERQISAQIRSVPKNYEQCHISARGAVVIDTTQVKMLSSLVDDADQHLSVCSEPVSLDKFARCWLMFDSKKKTYYVHEEALDRDWVNCENKEGPCVDLRKIDKYIDKKIKHLTAVAGDKIEVLAHFKLYNKRNITLEYRMTHVTEATLKMPSRSGYTITLTAGETYGHSREKEKYLPGKEDIKEDNNARIIHANFNDPLIFSIEMVASISNGKDSLPPLKFPLKHVFKKHKFVNFARLHPEEAKKMEQEKAKFKSSSESKKA